MRKALLCVFVIFLSLLFSCRQHEQRNIKFTHIYDPLAGPQGKLNMDWINARIANFYELQPELQVELEQVKWDQIDTKCMADYRAGFLTMWLLRLHNFFPNILLWAI